MFRLLRVNMAESSAVYEDIPACFRGLGGRGLAAGILAHECFFDREPSGCGPFMPGARLVFAPGLLGATAALPLNRLAVVGLHPERGGPRSAVSTSQAATDLLRLGILGIIIENAAPGGQPLQLEVREGRADLMPSCVTGLGIGAAVAKLRLMHGPCSLVLNGPAGEARLPAANIAFSLPHGALPRRAGRGLGALMGDMGLKNIVIFPPDADAPPAAAPKEYAKAAARLAKALEGLSARLQRSARSEGERAGEKAKKAGEQEEAVNAGSGKGRGGRHCSQACGLCGSSVSKGRGLRRREAAAYNALWQAAGCGALWHVAATGGASLRTRFDEACDEMGLDAFAVSALAAARMEKGALRAAATAAVIAAVESIASGGTPDWLSGHMDGGAPQGRPGKGVDGERYGSAFADAMGLCVYAAPAVLGDREVREALADLLNARYGWALPPDYALSLGERILKIEEGFTPDQCFPGLVVPAP